MSTPPLLPSDHYLIQVLSEAGVDITEDDWRAFKQEVRFRASQGPRPAVVAGAETLAIISLVLTVASVGLTIVASFFKPKPGRPASLETRQQDPENRNNVRRYAPRYGFDAVQDPAAIGTTIPLVYALRETFQGETVGGIRINLLLIWSQMQSVGGSQLLRAIFLLSEGSVAEIDPTNFAIGNNSISSYDLGSLSANQLGSRLTAYFRGNGGRLRSADRVLGRSASNDLGNAEIQGGPDVFAVRRSGIWTTDFSASTRPSTQTAFGITAFIGNDLGYRVNPSIRPTVNAQLVPDGDDGDARVVCPIDEVSRVARDKYTAIFSTRSGLINGSVGSVGSQITYRLDNSSDAQTEFIFSTADKLRNWTLETTVIENPFPADYGITDAELAGLVVLSGTQLDTINKKLDATISINQTEVINKIGSETVDDGTYTVEYQVVFVENRNDSESSQRIKRKYKVRIYKTTRYRASTAGQSYTNPVLQDNGNGNYVLIGGNTTFSNGDLLVDRVRIRFKPPTRTYSINYRLKDAAIEPCGDVASAVSARQKAWDDAIVVGDLYKVGSALAICSSRTPADSLFESSADFTPPRATGGQPIDAVFTTVRPGTASLSSLTEIRYNGNDPNNTRHRSATNYPHIYKIALGNITTTRACQVVEIGLRSVLGIRISGLCNFRDCKSYQEVNNRACRDYLNDTIEKGKILKVDIYQSGTISTSEERYSFFRISFREAGTNAPFTELSPCFGIRCITQQPAYNSLRFNMGSVKRWEFRFEPLSGWEIRSGAASGSLELIDSKLSTDRSLPVNGINITYKGATLTRSVDTFALHTTRRDGDDRIGIRYTDSDSYVDAWGKLAESFVYEEVQSSVSGSPEHEIVYVNEIVPNATAPTYDNLAIVGLNIRSSVEFQQFSQLSAYVTKGIQCRQLLNSLAVGPTHLFPDVLLDLLTNTRYGRGDLIPDELIDLDSFRTAAQWCRDRGYFFDGAITTRQNLRQWAADTAATHLLIFGEANGKFFLRPAFTFSVVQIKGLFTAGNIRENSFKLQYLDIEERKPIQVSVRWREERADSNPTNPGLFPLEREILVREFTTSDTAPVESIDMSDYCTRREHAIDAAKYVARARRLSTNAIRFETTHEGVLMSLAPSDYIKVAMDVTVYDEFNNGIVTPAGALVSTQPLTDSSYPAILWNGQSNTAPYDGNLVVTDGGTKATPTGTVFTLKKPGTEVHIYQIESIEPTEDGYLAIEAVHAPTSPTGTLAIADGFDNGGNWTLQE